MLRIFWYVMLLVATTTVICGAQAPAGVLIERSDGSYQYIVDSDDRLGQWQVAFGEPALWLELVSANPQLRNPHKINPGDTLNIPTSMVRLFRIMLGSNNLATTTHDTIFVPAATSSKPEMSDLLVLLIIAAVALIMYMIGAGRTKMDIESKRKIEDPYSGPDRVEGGLPTAEAAINYFTRVYENERLMMTVGEAENYPPVVHITRIVPVDVRGPMWLCYGGSDNPVEKNLPDWTPAWQCWLDDGTYRISLMRCGNDVRSGLGMTPLLSEDQIRPRQDMKAVELNHQIWPVLSADQQQAAELAKHLEMPADVPRFREVRIKSPDRFVLLDHNCGETTLDVAMINDAVKLSFVNNQIIAETVYGNRQVVGMIGEKDPLKESTDAENLALIKASETADPAPLVD